MKFQSNTTVARNNKRIWFEGKRLIQFGFKKGKLFTVSYNSKSIIIKLDNDGTNTVSGRKRSHQTEYTPIIDICNEQVTEFMSGKVTVNAKLSNGKITVTL